MPSLSINGAAINYTVIGQAGPWISLTPGGRRSQQEFAGLAAKIASHGFRVLLHDRRNTGASDVVIAGDDSEEGQWVDDLLALLTHLDATPAFVAGSSSGSRMSILFALRHPQAAKALLLFRVTGGAVAAKRLPENYYAQYIRAAEQGGMAAVCATEHYRDCIAANPANAPRLLAMDPADYIAVMSRWLSAFMVGIDNEVTGISDEHLTGLRLPVIVIPGNDQIHSRTSGLAARRLIPGSELHELPLQDTGAVLIPFEDWAPQEEEIAEVFADFMHRVDAALPVLHRRGHGAPILLLHCLGVDHRLWDIAAAGFEGDYEVLSCDFPGHGDAPVAMEPYDIAHLSNQVAAMMAAAGVTRATIAGISLGGLVAQHLAATRPSLVERLVLIDTTPRYTDAMRAGWVERAAVARSQGVAALTHSLLPVWFTDAAVAADGEAVRYVRDCFGRCSGEAYALACEALAVADLRDLAPQIKAPTLVVCSDDDIASFKEAANWLHDAIPHSQLVWLGPARHASVLEQPAAFMSAMRSFLTS